MQNLNCDVLSYIPYKYRKCLTCKQSTCNLKVNNKQNKGKKLKLIYLDLRGLI